MKVMPADMVTLHVDWWQARPLVENALDRTLGEENSTSIYLDAAIGHKQFWYAKNDEGHIVGIVVTQLLIHVTQARECRIVLVSGKPHQMKHWFIEMRDMITDWAKEQGCQFIVGYGRDGWEKLFDNYADKVYTVFAKHL